MKKMSNELDIFHRLSPEIIPLNYHLKIYPNLDTFKIEGTVLIDLQVKSLNFKYLTKKSDL